MGPNEHKDGSGPDAANIPRIAILDGSNHTRDQRLEARRRPGGSSALGGQRLVRVVLGAMEDRRSSLASRHLPTVAIYIFLLPLVAAWLCCAARQIYRELSMLGEKISIIFVEVLASEPLVSVRLLCYRHAPPSAVREHMSSSSPGVCECFEDAAFFSTPSPLPLLITNHLPPILPCAPRLFRRRTWIPRTRRGRGRC